MEAARQNRLNELYSDSWMSRLKAYVSRRYNDFGDWEGWFEEAHQNLALKIDKMPLEQELSDALIYAIFKNELISVKRNRLGYPRPRKWLQQFSALGQDLFEWMCLQRLSRDEIIKLAMHKSKDASYKQALLDSGSNEAGQQTSSYHELLIELTDTMIAKKECEGVRPGSTSLDDESVGQIAEDKPTVEDNTDHAQLGLMLSLILGTDNINSDVEQVAAERLYAVRAALKQEPLLSDMDILILRCYYFQGMSQNEVAKLVKQPLQRVVRQREAAIKKVGAFLETHGLNKEALL
ncbi:MAG: hypothetical protein AB8B79_07765 [Granulosicoccus sp.]